MCYPKPGPRCTPHAEGYLYKAKERLESALIAEKEKSSTSTRERLSKALDNFCERQSDYDTTPDGLLLLAKNYQQKKGTAQEEVYKKRLSYAKAKREIQSSWATEYSQLSKTKVKTSPKLETLTAKIDSINDAIHKNRNIYESAIYTKDKESTSTESVSWSPTKTQIKREIPEEIKGMNIKNTEKIIEEDTPQKNDTPLLLRKHHDIDVLKTHKRKIDSFSIVSEDNKNKRGYVSALNKETDSLSPMKRSVHHFDVEQKSTKPYSYDSLQGKPRGALVDMMGYPVSTHIINTPKGLAWIIQQDEEIKTIKIPQGLSEKNKNIYYQRIGLTEIAA